MKRVEAINTALLMPFLIKGMQEQQIQINQMKATLCKLGEMEYC